MSLPVEQLGNLIGLGDRWEAQVRDTFGREKQNYVAPTTDEFQQARGLVYEVSQAVLKSDADRLASLQQDAERLGLRLTQLETGQERLYLLEENPPKRGWGKVLLRSQPTQPGLVLEVPHPVFDGGTPELGVELFQDTGAEALLVAGAHRLNRGEPSPEQPHRKLADPAHTNNTFFMAAHQALVQPQDTVLQVHGFKSRKPEDPQIVLSDGSDDGVDPPKLVKLHKALQSQGYNAFLVDFQEDWLTARTNVQGHDMRERASGEFIHVEFNEQIRKGRDFGRIRQAVRDWLTIP